jgi:hypothetical protein
MRDRQSIHGQRREKKSGRRYRIGEWKIETPEPSASRARVPWVAGLGNRGGKTVGVLVGRRTSEGAGRQAQVPTYHGGGDLCRVQGRQRDE